MLHWHLKYGSKLEWFEDLEAQEERPIPALDSKPTLYPDLVLDWEAFWTISSSRQIGMSLGSIQISEVLAFMEMFGIDDYDQRKAMLRRIQVLDSAYLEYFAEKEKRKKR